MQSEPYIGVKKFKLAYIYSFHLLPCDKRPPIDLECFANELDKELYKHKSKTASKGEERNNFELDEGKYHYSHLDTLLEHLRRLDKHYFTPTFNERHRFFRGHVAPIKINKRELAEYAKNNNYTLDDIILSQISDEIIINPLLKLHTYGVLTLTVFVDLELNDKEISLENLVKLALILADYTFNLEPIHTAILILGRSVNNCSGDSSLAKIFSNEELRFEYSIPIIMMSIWDYTCSCPYRSSTPNKYCGGETCILIKKYVHTMMTKRTLRKKLVPEYTVLREPCTRAYLSKNISFVNGVKTYVHWGGALHLVIDKNYSSEQLLEQFLTLVWLEELVLFTGYLATSYNVYFWKIFDKIERDPDLMKKIQPSDLANLREELLGAIEEYHGVSLISDYLIRKQFHYLKKHLGIIYDFKTLMWRIRSLSATIEAKYDEDLKKRELILAFLLGALGLSGLSEIIYNISRSLVITLIPISIFFIIILICLVIIRDAIKDLFKGIKDFILEKKKKLKKYKYFRRVE